jgi:hypothetical protein
VNRRLRLRDLLVILGLFLPLIGYCVYGALTGSLYIPSRRGPGGAYFTGLNAWLFVVSFSIILVAILIRERVLGHMGDRARTATELILLFLGAGLLFVPRGEHTECVNKSYTREVAATNPAPSPCRYP